MSMAEFFKDLIPYTSYKYVSYVSQVSGAKNHKESIGFSDTCLPVHHETCKKIDVSTVPFETCLEKDVSSKDRHVARENPFYFNEFKTFETCATYETCDFEHIQYNYEERAAIMEFDGKFSRARAEAFAHDALLAATLNPTERLL